MDLFERIEQELVLCDKISIESIKEFAKQREAYLNSNLTNTEEKNHELYFKQDSDI